MASLKELDKGNSVKLVLTVNGQVKEPTSSSSCPGSQMLSLLSYRTSFPVLSFSFSLLLQGRAASRGSVNARLC